jgi:hypothetical protein
LTQLAFSRMIAHSGGVLVQPERFSFLAPLADAWR